MKKNEERKPSNRRRRRPLLPLRLHPRLQRVDVARGCLSGDGRTEDDRGGVLVERLKWLDRGGENDVVSGLEGDDAVDASRELGRRAGAGNTLGAVGLEVLLVESGGDGRGDDGARDGNGGGVKVLRCATLLVRRRGGGSGREGNREDGNAGRSGFGSGEVTLEGGDLGLEALDRRGVPLLGLEGLCKELQRQHGTEERARARERTSISFSSASSTSTILSSSSFSSSATRASASPFD